MPRPKVDQDKADEGLIAAPPSTTKRAVVADRIKDAYFLGGRWIGGDGTPLNDQESQQAHRAADARAAEAKRKALLGGGE